MCSNIQKRKFKQKKKQFRVYLRLHLKWQNKTNKKSSNEFEEMNIRIEHTAPLKSWKKSLHLLKESELKLSTHWNNNFCWCCCRFEELMRLGPWISISVCQWSIKGSITRKRKMACIDLPSTSNVKNGKRYLNGESAFHGTSLYKQH